MCPRILSVWGLRLSPKHLPKLRFFCPKLWPTTGYTLFSHAKYQVHLVSVAETAETNKEDFGDGISNVDSIYFYLVIVIVE